jgi:hypothetical protein
MFSSLLEELMLGIGDGSLIFIVLRCILQATLDPWKLMSLGGGGVTKNKPSRDY